ncbi:polymorphic toxin type 50 domain-containing protein [Amphibacillus jilinensis]|uniref:polymorphic toxin type 50 domain-containing protein n=1 Tax=Amphibacillus jilinensis TaxID=1216008 RepID=UPI001F4997D7|nr:polymorphic toxin type 50 domain-containing protein [Amphibacillus jilinensis]
MLTIRRQRILQCTLITLPNGKKERLEFDKLIGKYYYRDTGEYLETTRGMIHYGKGGSHIVPSRP